MTVDAVRTRPVLGPSEAAVFETFVVPRYLNLFGELAVDVIERAPDAVVAHLQCRTGYGDRILSAKLPGAHVFGTDESLHAVELARAKAASVAGMTAEYRVADKIPVPLPSANFSHAYVLHPSSAERDRRALFAEMARLLRPGGQAVVAMPLRGSFQEVFDLVREYALKWDATSIAKAVDDAIALRPSVERLGAELEDAGFAAVDVELRPTALKFQSGRDFFDDPATRLLLLPELCEGLTIDLGAPLNYVRDAIDKYWSDSCFELTIQVACASGRRAC